MKTINLSRVNWLEALMIGLLVAAGTAVFLANPAGAAPRPNITPPYYVDGSHPINTCKNTTAVGYTERMQLMKNSSSFAPNNYSLTVSGGASTIPIQFMVEVWFCKPRITDYGPGNNAIKTSNYRAVIGSTNIMSSPSPSSSMVSSSNGYHQTVSRGGYTVHRMKTERHTANLNISSFKDGQTKKVCLKNDTRSYMPLSFHIQESNHCFNLTINYRWDASASSATTGISSSVALPGDTVRWTHTVTNNGPGKTDKTVRSWEVDSSRASLGSSANTAQGVKSGNVIRRFTSQKSITDTDLGKSFCRGAAFTPRGSTNSGTGYSNPACVSVPYNWTMSPSIVMRKNGATAANNSTALPGDIMSYQHEVRNTGRTRTSGNVAYGYKKESAATQVGSRIFTANGTANSRASFTSSSYRVTQSDVGKTICRSTYVKPRSHTNSSEQSASRCFQVPYQYNLTPSIPGVDTVEEPGTKITIEPTIDNDGPTKSRDTQWQLITFKLPPSRSPKPGASNTSTPCVHSGGDECEVLREGEREIPEDGWDTPTHSHTLEEMEVGSQLCFALSVRPPSNRASQSTWRHSNPRCITVGKKPKVQIWGGDVRSQGRIQTSLTTLSSGRTFGSWGEYGVLSNRFNRGLASAGTFNYGASGSAALDKLTFANTSDEKGNFGSLPTHRLINQFQAMEPTNGISGTTFDVSGRSSGVYEPNGNINLRGSISQGRSIVVLAPTRTVTITGNLTYNTSNLSQLSDIPQLVVVAKNINIQAGVTRIDAWLLASEEVNTCSNEGPSSGALTIKHCSRRLDITGPVETPDIKLRRTAGSESGSSQSRQEPAEVFNLRSDALLWSYQESLHNGLPSTVNIRELPPRF